MVVREPWQHTGPHKVYCTVPYCEDICFGCTTLFGNCFTLVVGAVPSFAASSGESPFVLKHSNILVF